MIMKKFFILGLLAILPFMASAYDVEVNGIYYNLITKGNAAEVTSGDANYTGNVIIPEEIIFDGVTYSVTFIGNSAFLGCSSLISVTIPNSVSSIGDNAFQNCYSLTSIIIPNSVTSIGNNAFFNCFNLTSITIPNSVTSIGDAAFAACSSLTSITIPNSVTSIGKFAFEGCKGLTSVSIPDGMVSLENYVFSECSGLTSVTIPNSVKSLGTHTFQGCKGLSSITIPNSVTSIGYYTFENCSSLTSVHIKDLEAWCNIVFRRTSYDKRTSNPLFYAKHLFMDGTEIKNLVIPNSVRSIKTDAFTGCSGLTSVTIGNSVTSIGVNAFSGCSGLSSVTIPNSVTSIEKCAFANCSDLTDVYCYAGIVPSTISDAFEGSYIEYATLHVPARSIDDYKTAEPWKNFKNIVKIGMPEHSLIYMIDNEVYKLYQIEEGEIITPEPTPTKEGYTFSGWSEIPETMPSHDVTVTGSFSINSYKLTYVVDGVEYKTVEVEYNSAITPEAEPTKEGHTFSGWSEIPGAMPANDVTVTGSFTINNYTLTYMVDGEVYKTSVVDYGTTITPEAAPTKTGYIFSGWDDVPLTMPARDVTVNGTFAINSYKLTYIVDGEEYKTFEIVYDSAITPEAEPTKEGHTFSGWSEIPKTMPANDVTVTGSFIVNKYQVTYIIDGEVFATDYVEYGAAIVPPTVEEKEGLKFSGWADVPETMPAHNITIYGSFTSGIAEIVMATKNNVRIYSPNGKKIDKMLKGLNIVVLKDGTVKKIVVK